MSRVLRGFRRNLQQSAILLKKKTDVQVIEVPSGKFKRLKENQAKFQQQDGLPVYLKGGLRDKILFNICIIGLGVGLVWGLSDLVRLALPK